MRHNTRMHVHIMEFRGGVCMRDGTEVLAGRGLRISVCIYCTSLKYYVEMVDLSHEVTKIQGLD